MAHLSRLAAGPPTRMVACIGAPILTGDRTRAADLRERAEEAAQVLVNDARAWIAPARAAPETRRSPRHARVVRVQAAFDRGAVLVLAAGRGARWLSEFIHRGHSGAWERRDVVSRAERFPSEAPIRATGLHSSTCPSWAASVGVHFVQTRFLPPSFAR